LTVLFLYAFFRFAALSAFQNHQTMKKISISFLTLLLVSVSFFQGCRDNTKIDYPENFVSADTSTNTPDTVLNPDKTVKVYVCKSKGSKKYHLNENCGGLKHCTHTIVTMTAQEAEGKGLGLCGHEL
jgi:hypothetical protein